MRTRRLTAQVPPGNLPGADMRAPRVASLPRTPAGASSLVVRSGAGLPPVAAFDPPITPSSPAAPPLPPAGIGQHYEAKTVNYAWAQNANAAILSGKEQHIYTTQGQWEACDVFIQDTNIIADNLVLSIRVYATAAQGAPTLVSSGRFGLYALAVGQTARVPLWVAAARAQAANFQVTIQLESITGSPLPAAAGESSLITVVASNRSDDAPDGLGAVPLSPIAESIGSTALDAELLMVSGALKPTVAAPRYLHVHELGPTIVLTNKFPRYSFPLGAGVAAAGGGVFGGQFLFPPGTRPQGATGQYTVAASSTAEKTTLVADVVLQGLYR